MRGQQHVSINVYIHKFMWKGFAFVGHNMCKNKAHFYIREMKSLNLNLNSVVPYRIKQLFFFNLFLFVRVFCGWPVEAIRTCH